MSGSIIYPSSFSTTPTLTLHNGSTHRASAIVVKSSQAQLDYIVLPNKVLYDPNGAAQAPRLPETVTARVIVKMSSKAATVTEFEAMCGHVGKRATLTGTKVSSGTVTCTARLEQVENISQTPTHTGRMIVVQLTFRPLTHWA